MIIFSIVAILFAAILLLQRQYTKYSWDKDLEERLAYDFSRTRDEVKEIISKTIPDVTDEQLDAWTANERKLESMVIDGERKYFRRTASNLFLVDDECKAVYDSLHPSVWPEGHTIDDYAADTLIYQDVMATGKNIAQPRTMRVKYTITVDPGYVPSGKMIKCWMPYPRTDVARQTRVKFISAGVNGNEITDSTDTRLVFSGNESKHSTLFMKGPAKKGQPTVFHEEFEYTVSGEWHDLDSTKVKPYDKSTELYKEFTAEREAHIIFTPELKALAEEITAGIENPYNQVKAIYDYVDAYPWAGAREYSTIPNIPEYVYNIKHGDCGQQSLLLITLCRIKGIPAHFQSGFMMHPQEWNLHDWSEVYFEGIGWVPVDISFGKQKFQPEYFYLGGIDPWRMIVNQDFGKELIPAKKYPRSETVDFQRGEVEWAGGNIYFNHWHYDMEIEYL
ncbi:MAG: transglutaminase domain-containing protein [Bacteroidales bacterium]|nr:transglutaminase domain-containing protein [Bacteroidales bacterium]